MEKLCRKCDTVKPINQFRKDKHKKSGHGSYCKRCSSEMAKSWQRRNPEKRKARDEAWYAKNKERKAANDAKRLPSYRDRRREIDAARWAGLTPEQRRERWNSWYWANREHSLRYKRVQRIIRRSKDADWTLFPESLEYVQLIGLDPCVYCGGRAEAVDHIVPVAKNGTGAWDNLAPACTSCNSSKCDEDLLAFLLRVSATRPR
ncbi:HNH endonuclease [Streptomyces sp. LRE541]|uniref:HNH endonuclease n=1 Tax=Streptomyces sp. LRE541 TaxID=2931983 RepID=UPI00200EA57C|nr:HNH endonuclease signature motif containing protein [Streptomyces sp. LRE541]UPZ27619.1 HNH endonuclease [Streptomyces sp. LRE541]